MKRFKSHLDEKLKASDKMGDWVKDFQDSDAPQFKGKSKEKKRQMAVAAKLGAEREAGMREEVELDEAKEHPAYKELMDLAKKLNNRDTRAIQVLAGKISNFTSTGNRGMMKDMANAMKALDDDSHAAVMKIMNKHDKALAKSIHAKMGMKEEAEQIDEISKDLARSYKYKAQMSEPEDMRQYKNRSKGIERADKKLKKEEFELDEQAQYDLVESYLLENNIEVDTLSEEELNEIIGKVVGGAFKVGAKAAVGAAKVAGKVAKSVVKNKQGNVRGSMAAKNDAARAKLDKLKQQRTAEVKKKLEARKNKQLQTAVQRAKDKLAASKARAASAK